MEGDEASEEGAVRFEAGAFDGEGDVGVADVEGDFG